MKKSVVLLFVFLSLFSVPVFAKDSAGVLPNSFWYGFDRFFEKANLALTFDSVKLVKLHLSYAKERKAEALAEIENKNFKSAEALLNDYNYEMIEARKELKSVEGEEKSALSSELESLTSENRFTLQAIYKEIEEEERLRPEIRNYPYNITDAEEEKLKLKKELQEDLEKKLEELKENLEGVKGGI